MKNHLPKTTFKGVFVFIILLAYCTNIGAQESESNKDELADKIKIIEQKIAELESANELVLSLRDSISSHRLETDRLSRSNIKLEESIKLRETVEYNEKCHSIILALERSDKLLESYLNTIENLKKDDLIVGLLEINNPTSDALGFKFTDVVLQKSKRVFHQKLNGDDKVIARWDSVMDKVVNNNFVNAILKSSPITGLVSNVVSAATSFIREKKDKNDRVTELESVFEESDIEELLKELEDYIAFYEQLSFIGVEYGLELASLLEKSSELDLTVKKFRKELLAILEIEPGRDVSVTIEFGNTYDLSKSEKFDSHSSVLLDSTFIKAVEHVSSFELLELQVQTIDNEYKKIFTKFLDGYKDQITQAKNISFDDEDIKVKNSRTERLLRKIDKFKDDFLKE